jgi:recombination protein RecA
MRGQRQKQELDAALATIQRRYGPWALVRGKPVTAGSGTAAVPHIPTGFSPLDRALDIGGLPKGRLCELFGPATSGKTTLALRLLAQAQRDGGQVGYIDQALYFDPDYAHCCGLDLSRLLVGTTQDLETALVTMEALVRSGSLSALVLDTLNSLWTDREAVSRLTTTLNHLPAFLARSSTVLLVLHESSTNSSPALSALAHYATVRLQVAREGWLYNYGDIRGYTTQVEVLKNRVGPAGRVATIDIEFNRGVWGDGL